MERFELNILGCGSATPSLRHRPASQVINFRDKLFMVDCGEGAQLALRAMSLKFTRLSNVFISHLHGDHVFGLPGMLSTFDLHGKGGELTVHTFAEGCKVLQPFLDFFCRESSFKISYNVITPRSGIIYEDSGLTVETFPLYHRVPCTGFIFREKPRPRTYLAEMGKFHEVPIYAIASIKQGADFVKPDGTVIPNEILTTEPEPPISYAYCSDTMMDARVAKAVKGVDVIYHEATYDDSLETVARMRGHSTASQAATIARDAGAKCLILGHFSKRYKSEELHLKQARAIFPNTIAANELMNLNLREIIKNSNPEIYDK